MCMYKGFSQDLKTGCPKLGIEDFGASYFPMEATIYSIHVCISSIRILCLIAISK